MTGPAHAASVYREVSAFARAIVAKRVSITAGAGFILGELVRAGLLSDAVSGRVAVLLALGLDVLGVIVGIVWAQSGTTPADPALQPTATTGELLVPLRESEHFGPRPGFEEGSAPLPGPEPEPAEGSIVFTPVPSAPEESA